MLNLKTPVPSQLITASNTLLENSEETPFIIISLTKKETKFYATRKLCETTEQSQFQFDTKLLTDVVT